MNNPSQVADGTKSIVLVDKLGYEDIEAGTAIYWKRVNSTDIFNNKSQKDRNNIILEHPRVEHIVSLFVSAPSPKRYTKDLYVVKSATTSIKETVKVLREIHTHSIDSLKSNGIIRDNRDVFLSKNEQLEDYDNYGKPRGWRNGKRLQAPVNIENNDNGNSEDKPGTTKTKFTATNNSSNNSSNNSTDNNNSSNNGSNNSSNNSTNNSTNSNNNNLNNNSNHPNHSALKPPSRTSKQNGSTTQTPLRQISISRSPNNRRYSTYRHYNDPGTSPEGVSYGNRVFGGGVNNFDTDNNGNNAFENNSNYSSTTKENSISKFIDNPVNVEDYARNAFNELEGLFNNCDGKLGINTSMDAITKLHSFALSRQLGINDKESEWINLFCDLDRAHDVCNKTPAFGETNQSQTMYQSINVDLNMLHAKITMKIQQDSTQIDKQMNTVETELKTVQAQLENQPSPLPNLDDKLKQLKNSLEELKQERKKLDRKQSNGKVLVPNMKTLLAYTLIDTFFKSSVSQRFGMACIYEVKLSNITAILINSYLLSSTKGWQLGNQQQWLQLAKSVAQILLFLKHIIMNSIRLLLRLCDLFCINKDFVHGISNYLSDVVLPNWDNLNRVEEVECDVTISLIKKFTKNPIPRQTCIQWLNGVDTVIEYMKKDKCVDLCRVEMVSPGKISPFDLIKVLIEPPEPSVNVSNNIQNVRNWTIERSVSTGDDFIDYLRAKHYVIEDPNKKATLAATWTATIEQFGQTS